MAVIRERAALAKQPPFELLTFYSVYVKKLIFLIFNTKVIRQNEFDDAEVVYAKMKNGNL